MRNRTALLLVIAMLLSMLNIHVFAAENTSASDDTNKINMVFDMGIFTEDDDGDRLLDDKVTRINLLIAVYRLMNYDRVDVVPVATKQYYSDISLYHYGAGYAQEMTESGFINGYGDGTYGVDNPATLNECCAILLRSAGYTNYFNIVGKTPYEVALGLDMLKAIKIGPDDYVTRKDVARILYNLMFVQCLEPDTTSGNNIKYSAGGEYIKEVLKLDYSDGILDGINGISLFGSINEDRVSVSQKIYMTNNTFSTDYLGYKVRVIFDPNSDIALSVIPDDKNKSVKFDAEDIEKYEDNTYFQYKSKGSTATTKYKVSKTFDAVYNRYPVFDSNYMVPEYGEVLLIDNNNDNEYDVVVINAYESAIADAYSLNDNTVILKNTEANGENTRIDFDDYGTCRVISPAGKIVEPSAINSGTVLTIQASVNKEYIYIQLNEEIIKGTIGTVSNEDNGIEVTVDGKKYKTVPKFYISGWELANGVKTDMYIDVNGRVAGFIKSKGTDDWHYGYVKNIYIEDDGETTAIRLFTENNKVENIPCTSRVVIDGSRISDPSAIVNVIKSAYNQFESADITSYTSENNTKWLIRYYLSNDGKVTKLDTPIVQSLYDTKTPEGFSTDNCLMLRAKGYIYWKSGQRTFKTVTAAHMDVPGDIYGQETMKICLIPQDLENSEDTEFAWKPLSSTSFSEIHYYASGYNTTVDSTECTVMAIRNKNGTSTKKMMVIDKVGEVFDDGDTVVSVTGYVGSSYKTLPVKESSFALTHALTKGDVIFYDYIDGKCVIQELGYSKHAVGSLDTVDAYHPDDGGSHFNIPYRIIKGKIARVSDDHMQLTPASVVEDRTPKAAIEMMRLPSTVIIYDSKTGKITPGNVYDIKTIAAYGDDADTVFVSTRSGTIDEMIAIR